MNKTRIVSFLLAAAAAVSMSAGAAETAASAPLAPEAAAQTEAGEARGGRPLDEIAAVVNDDVITEFELQQQTHMASLNLSRQGIKLPPMNVLRRQVLDQMILDKAVNQRARETGIRVDDPMVSAAIEQIAQTNNITVEQLREKLAGDKVPFAVFREQVRRDIMLQRLREREVDSQIQIPESEVDAYLSDEGMAGRAEYRVSHILIPVDQTVDEASAQQTADDVIARAKGGEDFASLAASYSKAGDSMSGGDLGWRTSGNMPSVLWDALKANPVKGEVAGIRDASGFHIAKITDVKSDTVQASGGLVRMTHARHILMPVTATADEATVLSRMNDIRRQIVEKKSDFQTMARLHSVDGSATRGGDLGWLQPGDTVPEFESAMDSLAPGEVSEPIKSRFGYHLIQVEERKEAKSDPRRARFQAMQALREKKLSDAVVDWERELRDKAYVEIRNSAE